MLSSMMKDVDEACWKYTGAMEKARKMAKKMLLQNEPIDKIIEYTELSEADVLTIKAEIEKQ